MDNTNIKQFHQQYFEAIKQLQDKQDIINNMPKPEYESFFEIMPELIEFIIKEIEETTQLLARETDEELIEWFKEDIEIWNFKLTICKQSLKEAKEMKETEKLATITPQKNFIFATTSSGNIYLEKDLKDIPEEYYDSIGESLEKLKNGYEENNEEKAKALKSNRKLAGLHEIKLFKVRVVYQNLSPDTVFIIMAKMKKSDNDKKDREEMIVRKNQTDIEFKRLKKEILDPLQKQTLIDEHHQIYDKLFKQIRENRRG